MTFAVLEPSQWVDDPDYPDDDGKPMSDNTLQYDWISILKWSLEFQYADAPDVFVAGNLLWYPRRKLPGEKGYPPRTAPDAMVVFNRPKGYRGSYRQWLENDLPPTVVFEVWSPGNDADEMDEKRQFYDDYGVEEYYLIRPLPKKPATAEGRHRANGRLVGIPSINGWVSPRLGIRFEMARGQLRIFHPDASLFTDPLEKARQVGEERKRAERERKRAAQNRRTAAAESKRAEAESRRAESESKRAESERQQKEKLAAKLRELGIDPDQP